MKVICVDATGCPELKEGDSYTVIGEFEGDSYFLKEVKYCPISGNRTVYLKSHFIPCNGVCEMELLEQRQDQLQSL